VALLIACILIFEFDLHWWMYAIAVATAGAQFWLRDRYQAHLERNMDSRFNNLQESLWQRIDDVIAKIPD
jgi:hypothetical protein